MQNKIEVAIFGGGCFWCTEAIFKMLNGVESVSPGYTGGAVPNPTYDQVCTGNTGHAEAIKIEYDPEKISFETLMTVFFGSHDPTTLNRQGNDIGTQYRSAIFYTTPKQKEEAEKFIAELNSPPASSREASRAGKKEGDPIVTEITSLSIFYPAENYHKDYFSNHSQAPYCQVVINPKLEKVQQKFAELLKSNNE
jgi:peptide-methionine (S)-S-oxide reductase